MSEQIEYTDLFGENVSENVEKVAKTSMIAAKAIDDLNKALVALKTNNPQIYSLITGEK